MKHNAAEFVNFLSSHFRPIEAMCRERVRFSRDDEIVAFLHRFEEDDKNVSKLIGRMREVGVLRELTGLWSLVWCVDWHFGNISVVYGSAKHEVR